MADYPRILIDGITSQPQIRWRVVVDARKDANGVVRETRFIELADERDTDAMGVQRWQQVTMKSGLSQWALIAEAAIDLALERVYEPK